jgi:outer membrane protein OmpA-like peptidoglycan-associated protein
VADTDPSSPVFVYTPPRGAQGSLALGLTGELFRGTAFVRYLGAVDPEPLLEGGLLTGVGARGSVGRRLELAAQLAFAPTLSLPSTLTAGAPTRGLGDLGVSAPVGLVLPRDDGTGFALGLVPDLVVPTGNSNALVGEVGLAGGLRLAGLGTTDRFQLAGDVGARLQQSEFLPGLSRGAGRAVGAAAVGFRPAGQWWLHGELRAWSSIGGNLPDAGSELFATTAVRAGPLKVTAGAGRGAFGGGLGAASLRVFTSLSWVRAPREAEDVLPPTGVDGFVFQVKSPEGRPVAGAEVLVDGEVVGQTGLDGKVVLAEEPRWSQVSVRAPGYLDTGVERSPEGVVVPVALAFAPSPVAVSITDPEGRPLAATALAREQAGGAEFPLRDGDALPPGRYDLEISAPGFGTQHRVVEVYPRAPLDPLDVVLLPDTGGRAAMAITLLDASGAPVDGARVLVDGVPVGATDQGILTLEALAPGPHTVEVLHDGFTTTTATGVVLADDAELSLPITLERVPGTVRVRVRAPDGLPVDDAVVRFIGPRRLPPMELGVQGERAQVLGAGTWVVTVTSPRYGLQEREIVVSADRFEQLDVDFVLQADELGGGELVVRVIDPEGRPVPGVEIAIDDRPYGRTATGGTLSVASLVPGIRAMELSGPGLRPIPPRDVSVAAGRREELFTAEWLPGSVDVSVRHVDGPAEGARVRFLDATGEGAGHELGPDGHLLLTLEPGTWTVVVTSPTAGIQERDLTIAPDATRLHRVDFVLAPQEDGLASLSLRVVDPLDRPVDGARVSLDGEPRGTTSNLGTLALSDLDVGTRNLVVWTEPYEAEVRDVRLLEGEHELELALDWSVGATRVHVVRDGHPLENALVRFLGDHAHPPLPVDTQGDALTRLEPGLWLVVATSPTGGVAEWDLEVKPAAGLNQVELDMSNADDGRVDLFVRVVDPYGRPVEHAVVWLEGDQKAGETQQGGAILARDLEPGIVSLRVEAPDFLPTTPIDVELVPGTVERIVRIAWPEVPVQVLAVDEAGDPVEAVVQWIGPRDVPELRSDTAGRVEATLSPGSWRAIARAADGRALAGEVQLTFDLGDEPRPKTIELHPTRAVMAGEVVTVTDTVPFEFGKATLSLDAGPIVEEIARLLLSQPDLVRIEVQGHTDNVGGVPFNQALSQARADAVLRALVARGVAAEKLSATGFGPTRPIAPNATEEGRAANRRVQLVIVERAAPVR